MSNSWSVYTDWLTALGTVVAVIVALFYAPIRKWFARPKLNIQMNHGEPWVEYSYVQWNNSQHENEGYYLRFDIVNRGKMAARNVRLRFDNVEINNESGKQEIIYCLFEAARWETRDRADSQDIIPNTSEFVSLLKLIDNRSIVTNSTKMANRLYPNMPGPLRDPEWHWILDLGRKELRKPVNRSVSFWLHVVSDNSPPKYYCLDIKNGRDLTLELSSAHGQTRRGRLLSSVKLSPTWLSRPSAP